MVQMKKWSALFQEPNEHDEPYEGVRQWMHRPLIEWLEQSFTIGEEWGQTFDDVKSVEQFDMLRRNSDPLGTIVRESSVQMMLATRSDQELLELVDFCLANEEPHQGPSQAAPRLEEILESSGSVWTVGLRGERLGLLRRVSEEEKKLFLSTQGPITSAGKLLAEAWEAFYGVKPNYELAHSQAVKAVEEALLPVVLPNDKKSTLGKALSDLKEKSSKEKKSEGLKFPLNPAVVPMLETIWNQGSRHGSNGYHKPTKDEAELVLFYSVVIIASLKRKIV